MHRAGLHILRSSRRLSPFARLPSSAACRNFSPCASQPQPTKWNATQQNAAHTSRSRYIKQLLIEAESGRLHECLSIVAQMKSLDLQPDLATYNALLHAAASHSLWLEAWAIYDDMILLGIKPSIMSFNHLIHAQRHRPSADLWKVMDRMKEADISPNASTNSMVIRRFIADGNLEFAMQWLHTSIPQAAVPELATAQAVIALAAKQGYPRLALDLLKWFQSASPREVEYVIWVQCLISSAENLYAEGVLTCWDFMVHRLKMLPDEGVCTMVLTTAARHGLSDLASEAMHVLRQLGVQWQENHYSAHIEALCNAGKLRETFGILYNMRSSGLDPGAPTTNPLHRVLTQSYDKLDSCWAILDSMHHDGEMVDISVLRALMQAAITMDDLQRAVGTFKSYAEYGVQPDISTFNLLLSGCVAAHHRELGDQLLKLLKEHKIRPNQDTYERMVELCLTQETYEDAFFYLEEMKAVNFRPKPGVYEAIIRACASANDPRWQIAMNEMVEQGHHVSRALHEELEHKFGIRQTELM